MLMSSSDLPEKSVKVKEENKFSSRSLSREISVNRSSVEVYYGGASGAVPFMWESQPGTPKAKFHVNPLPPLTPPPSFHSDSMKKPIKKHSKPNLLHTVLPKLNLRKTSYQRSPASSLSWSSSRSVPSSPFTPSGTRGQFQQSSPRSSLDLRMDEEDEYGSPVSTLCFGIGRGTNARSRGCSPNIMKVLL